MSANVFCPTCGAKICEIVKSRDLKIKCKKCKSEVTIDKDETKLKVESSIKTLTRAAE